MTSNKQISSVSISFHCFLVYEVYGESTAIIKPAVVVSPKLSRILLEKGAVSPPPAWIKKFEPIVTQDPMTIRKYLGKESNSQMRSDLNAYRFLLLLVQGQSCIILPRAHIATSTHAHGESDEKEKRQAGVNKISCTEDCVQYACVWRWRIRWRCDNTDRQTFNLLTDLAQNLIRTYIHDDETVYETLSI
ncbi:hypothetical protein AVEN_40511-1 [Araneus ventricosus]|uniref:Uncharacterized protein n=1 Tax=Araneus ventricosus TaxID=182803 RepID=A0A4Y2IMK9_ARAVE|nr:hypothetical protein AVEN_40511-1 [Araneus ventricosus]